MPKLKNTAKKATVKKTTKKTASVKHSKLKKGEAKAIKIPRGRSKLSIRVSKQRYKDVILILDFGSQYTQLIARRIRESKVFCKIVPFNISAEDICKENPKGLILSGGPLSVYDEGAPLPKAEIFEMGIPVLGICYGLQAIVHLFGGKIQRSKEREFGRSELFVDRNRDLFLNLPANITCWMSHSDMTTQLPKGYNVLAHTLNAPVAAIGHPRKKIFGVQFHPEVVHTQHGVD
ncbi:MAG TPA: glutamine-hydrolyzing GMP synthase, partial [Candidatus Omnitrophota bacterium]|nr:glutamine-hydrolyzing GMP synthase [Candidatus Omnitrophota bacterium]